MINLITKTNNGIKMNLKLDCFDWFCARGFKFLFAIFFPLSVIPR